MTLYFTTLLLFFYLFSNSQVLPTNKLTELGAFSPEVEIFLNSVLASLHNGHMGY